MPSRFSAKKRPYLILLFLLMLLFVSVFLSLSMGALDIGLSEMKNAFLSSKPNKIFRILFYVRLPRTLVAALVGMCLSLSGAILQGVMKNPMASPSILGVNAGAGLFAYIIFILFPSYLFLTPLAAFTGAMLTSLLVYTLAYKNGVSPLRLILSGIAVAAVLGAMQSTLVILFPEKAVGASYFMVGGLSGVTWPDLKRILPYFIFGTLLISFFPKQLNLLGLGDESAKSLGLPVEKFRLFFIACGALFSAISVSIAGLLSFVGLIVPHIARLLVGHNHQYLLPASALLGANLVLLCDTLARVLIRPAELPVGIILSLLGAPFFLYLLRRKKDL